ncbi:MAG TPA: hypothetical protein VEK80_06220, partial [Kribbellaceae bacterium]|nr:hypothetical protein [Kribbellaceae bacterium]
MTATPHTDETAAPATTDAVDADQATAEAGADDSAEGAAPVASTRKPKRPRKAAAARSEPADEAVAEEPAAEPAYPPLAPGEADSVLRAEQTPGEDQPYLELGLREDEYARIRQILGRRPTQSELAMYAIMWSEHCSYKSSKVHLRQFSEKAPKTDALLVGIGENAGVVDAGDGW